MTKSRLTLGKMGEDAAAEYLSKLGFKIINRNFRCKLGELDIIAKHKDSLVFIEVRTVAVDAYIKPVESINFKKQKKIRQLAVLYLASQNLKNISVRFDVVAVTMMSDGIAKKIEHIPNAF